MKALVTGSSGTVGSALCRQLEMDGHDAVRYDRSRVGVTDVPAIHAFVHDTMPDVVFHLATATRPTGMENEGYIVSQEWTESLARAAADAGAGFVYTSSVMVYSEKTPGPYMPETPASATEGYGPEKSAAEHRARAGHAGARVARLSWQIGETPDSNNMLAFLQGQSERDGVVRASRRWLPACCFLGETAKALIRIAAMPAGTYLVNQNGGWNFFQIARALNRRHGSLWRVEPTEDFVYDQRMFDERVNVPLLEDTLPELREGL